MITEKFLRILLEGKPALQRDIMLKAKPFLKKYGIDFDLSNYQNDGYLRAGGYKFWFDDEERDFRTNEPKYAGKGFADIRELLAYALDIKEAEKEYRNTWGIQTYLARSKPNKGYSNNLYKKVVSEETIVEGSHHAKYPPAINYKCVNNYLIKARKALKEGNIKEAEKWAWEANITMHEDEMQGPGVAADKNAYNIFHKQLSNIHSAILAAKKANKENN